MTTIAYKAGVLAGDTQITDNGTATSLSQRKVFKLRDGRLYGYCGSMESGERILTALKRSAGAGAVIPRVSQVSALLIGQDGSVWLYEGNAWVKQAVTHFSMGSGADLALGAMDAGATAKQAVAIAIMRDVHSGGKVQSVKLRRQ